MVRPLWIHTTKALRWKAPSSGRSQSFEKYQDKDRPLDTADFEVRVDEENKEVSVLACPEKQAPTDLMRSEKTGKRWCILTHRCVRSAR